MSQPTAPESAAPQPAPAAVLSGQDIAEAHGAVTTLLERALTLVDANRHEYVALRVLTARGPYASPAELRHYLASQPQLGLTEEGVAALLASLEERGLAAGTDQHSSGPAQATPEGAALLGQLIQAVAPATRRLYAGLAQDDLAAAHRVLAHLTKRAEDIASQMAQDGVAVSER